jgi:hypothetical protein
LLSFDVDVDVDLDVDGNVDVRRNTLTRRGCLTELVFRHHHASDPMARWASSRCWRRCFRGNLAVKGRDVPVHVAVHLEVHDFVDGKVQVRPCFGLLAAAIDVRRSVVRSF